MDPPSCGIEVTCVPDIQALLHDALCAEFNFYVVPLVHPRAVRDFTKPPRAGAFTRSDLTLASGDWSQRIIGKVSTWLNFDSPEEWVRNNADKALKQEVSWASHLGLSAVLLPPPPANVSNYARALSSTLKSAGYVQIWVRVPMTVLRNERDPWVGWRTIRTLCEHHASLGVALEVTEDLPSDKEVTRWIAESVKAVMIPTSIFLRNKGGYPVLSKAHQKMLQTFYRHKIELIITGKPEHQSGYTVYMQYLHHLWQSRPPRTEQAAFEAPYYDYLQVPLQPLADNLESQTYEVFEKDPVKYAQYEEAVFRALTSPARASIYKDRTPVVMVVGAGRGPLVRASLRASARAKKPIKVWAVEKNPNAVVTLQNMVETERWDNVTIVASDMREWKAPEKADILVSELLGSFGDNELSPECLDGAQHFLADDGISVPSEYTSYLAPIQSAKLHQEVKSFGELKNFETSYVVKMHAYTQLAQSKPAFTFVHPNRDEFIDNSRFIELSFPMEMAATVHGFAGFFDATLFEDVHISINPETFSRGMFSWFPLLFPLRQPADVNPGDTLVCQYWRCCTKDKVWYEWSLTSPLSTCLHNAHGRSQAIGL